MNKKITLVIGDAGAGKSTYIRNLIQQFHQDPTYTYNQSLSTNANSHHEEIAVFERNGEYIVLNSGSDTESLIKRFANALSNCTNIVEIYTAIRSTNNPRLNLWMRRTVGLPKEKKPNQTHTLNRLTIEEYII